MWCNRVRCVLDAPFKCTLCTSSSIKLRNARPRARRHFSGAPGSVTNVSNFPCRSSYLCCSRRYMSTELSLGKGSYDVETKRETEDGLATPTTKPKTNAPFIKEIFVGNFDEGMLVFPEALSEEQLDKLTEKLKPFEEFMSTEVDAGCIDADAAIPESTIQRMKHLGLYGMQVPNKYGGLGLNCTETAKLMEILAKDASISYSLAMHNVICIKSILECGTEKQKAEFLTKLASGEYVAGLAMTEVASGCDLAAISTMATQSDDGNSFYLNGTKSIVTNGNTADIFIVFAKIETLDNIGDTVTHVTAFIVSRDADGIQCGPELDTLGARAASTCSVQFNNTPVPAENILGEIGDGFAVAIKATHNSRCLTGAWGAGIGKQLLAAATEHTINRSQFGKKLMKYGLIQKKLVNTSLSLYAMESMAYMTAAIVDTYEQPDVSIESAIVKLYTAERLQQCVEDCTQIFGGRAYMKQYPYERHIRDSRLFQLIFEGSNEMMRLFIALSGFQHAGISKMNLIKKMRDPLNNLGTIWNTTWQRMLDSRSNPKLTLGLHTLVHPTLSFSGEELEKRIMQFKYEVERYLAVFGDKIIDDQLLLERVTDIVVEVYAMTCTLARASRSKCIGLRNADIEARMTEMYCSQAVRRVDKWLTELETGRYCNGDQMLEEIAEDILKCHGYPVEHPLTRNW